MRIELHDGFHLTPVREGDQPAYVEHLADKGITDFMLLIPYPYTKDDADFWVRLCLKAQQTQPHPTEFAIRREDGFLVGAIGITLHTGKGAHRGHVGYWLAKAYRGRGVMTRAVKAVVAYGFATLGLQRIEATAFTHNPASQRVLERAGLTREGVLAGWHLKDGILIDACMFATVMAPRVGSSGFEETVAARVSAWSLPDTDPPPHGC